jgi:hypothetical protein
MACQIMSCNPEGVRPPLGCGAGPGPIRQLALSPGSAVLTMGPGARHAADLVGMRDCARPGSTVADLSDARERRRAR